MDKDTSEPYDLLPNGCKLRLYSMPLCPYAQRARLVLSEKKIQYDLVNIDLNNKPYWFFDINPNGEVPVIIHNANHIYQSLVVSEYLEDVFPEPHLYNIDPVKRAWEKIYFQHWTLKGIPAFYSLLKSGHLEPEQTKRLDGVLTEMEDFLKDSGISFYSGQRIGFADYMIWPWFERMPVLEKITGFEMNKETYPVLMRWIDDMRKDSSVMECSVNQQLLVDFYTKYRTGKPDFTMANKKEYIIEAPLENLDDLRDPSSRFRK